MVGQEILDRIRNVISTRERLRVVKLNSNSESKNKNEKVVTPQQIVAIIGSIIIIPMAL